MPRPRKLTMDFFIHDANASSDKKIKLLSKKHGNDGYATYFRLLESLCHEPGMQLSLKDPELAELLAEDYRLRDIQHLYKIIQCCADIKLLDKQLWETERVVFSHGLFNRYSDRLEDRKDAAVRQQRSREAKALQNKLDALNGVVTRDNAVTTEMSQDCHSTEANTDTEVRDSEVQNSEAKAETESLRSDPERAREENSLRSTEQETEVNPAAQHPSPPVQLASADQPAQRSGVNVPPPAAPTHDLFARRGMPHVVPIQAKFEGPWGQGYTDELKRFEAWLLEHKAQGKSNPSSWIAVVVDGIAKGGSRALWSEFERFESGEVPAEPETPSILTRLMAMNEARYAKG